MRHLMLTWLPDMSSSDPDPLALLALAGAGLMWWFGWRPMLKRMDDETRRRRGEEQ